MKGGKHGNIMLYLARLRGSTAKVLRSEDFWVVKGGVFSMPRRGLNLHAAKPILPLGLI